MRIGKPKKALRKLRGTKRGNEVPNRRTRVSNGKPSWFPTDIASVAKAVGKLVTSEVTKCLVTEAYNVIREYVSRLTIRTTLRFGGCTIRLDRALSKVMSGSVLSIPPV